MTPLSASRTSGTRSPRRTLRRRWSTVVRQARRWRKRARRTWRKFKAAPPAFRTVAIAAALLAVFAATNFLYQLVRKPTEMFFPVSDALKKRPAETWRQYAPLFRAYSTAAIPPELLAALAQVEGAGNPVARTYWRWRLSFNPFAIYRPASSAVGMYQMTDAAFAEAERYCIRDHAVVAVGPWNDWGSCWLNALYVRVVPSHAVELTAVFLDRNVSTILARQPSAAASPRQKQDLAAFIHLCGAAPARAFADRGFRQIAGERCGDHDVATYLAQVGAMQRQFKRLAVGGGSGD